MSIKLKVKDENSKFSFINIQRKGKTLRSFFFAVFFIFKIESIKVDCYVIFLMSIKLRSILH